MKLLLRIHFRSRMNSEISSESESEATIYPLADTVEDLLPVVDGLAADMSALTKKISEQPVTWLQTAVVPTTTTLRRLYEKHQIPPRSSIHAILNILFAGAKVLDLNTRVIYFSDEDATIFGKPAMTLFDLLRLILNSVEFV